MTPKSAIFNFEAAPTDVGGDGARFLKLAFEGIGEIDFIVASPKTSNPTIEKRVEGEHVLLETVPEIIAKKLFYRAASLQPRDIFDIAAAGETHGVEVVAALGPHKEKVIEALVTIKRLNPTFVTDAISSLQIRPAFAHVAEAAVERAAHVLQSV